MSKTYKKTIRQFCCTGSNTEWYRERNRMIRNIWRQHLRAALAHFLPDEVDENLVFAKFPKSDTWNEPTDGHYVYTKTDYAHDKKRMNNSSGNEWVEYDVELGRRMFKPRVRKHIKKN